MVHVACRELGSRDPPLSIGLIYLGLIFVVYCNTAGPSDSKAADCFPMAAPGSETRSLRAVAHDAYSLPVAHPVESIQQNVRRRAR